MWAMNRGLQGTKKICTSVCTVIWICYSLLGIDIVWKDSKISILHIFHISLDYWPQNCQTLALAPVLRRRAITTDARDFQGRDVSSKLGHCVANEARKQSRGNCRWLWPWWIRADTTFWFLIHNLYTSCDLSHTIYSSELQFVTFGSFLW